MVSFMMRQAAAVQAQRTSVPDEFRPVFAKEQTVRIVLGLYDHRLTDEGMDNLLTGEWKVTPVADRMELRSSGPRVKWNCSGMILNSIRVLPLATVLQKTGNTGCSSRVTHQ